MQSKSSTDSRATRHPASGAASTQLNQINKKENIMGKYFLAWLCGVPAFLLVLIYLFVH